MNTLWEANLFRTLKFPRCHHRKIHLLWIPCEKLIFLVHKSSQNNDSKMIKNKHSRNVMLCFVIDTCTILAKHVHVFLLDIGITSMIWGILLDGSVGFVGARLFQNWQKHEVQMCNIICFKDVSIYFLICFEVSWYTQIHKWGSPGGHKSRNHGNVRFGSLT